MRCLCNNAPHKAHGRQEGVACVWQKCEANHESGEPGDLYGVLTLRFEDCVASFNEPGSGLGGAVACETGHANGTSRMRCDARGTGARRSGRSGPRGGGLLPVSAPIFGATKLSPAHLHKQALNEPGDQLTLRTHRGNLESPTQRPTPILPATSACQEATRGCKRNHGEEAHAQVRQPSSTGRRGRHGVTASSRLIPAQEPSL